MQTIERPECVVCYWLKQNILSSQASATREIPVSGITKVSQISLITTVEENKGSHDEKEASFCGIISKGTSRFARASLRKQKDDKDSTFELVCISTKRFCILYFPNYYSRHDNTPCCSCTIESRKHTDKISLACSRHSVSPAARYVQRGS